MMFRPAGFALLLWFVANSRAQTVCPPTPRYSTCDLTFDVPGASGDQALDLHAEFRSPHQTTALVNAFWDGGTKWVIRFAPAEGGEYTYRLTGPATFNGKVGQFTATPNAKTGWLRAANVHHFANVEGNVLTPHLWMGGVATDFAQTDLAHWKAVIDTRASQHFNHMAVTLVDRSSVADFRSPAFFQAAEAKIRYANDHGILVDVAFFGPDNLMNRLLPSHDDRQRWFAYALSRLAAFDVTWQGLEAWESYDNARDLLKEIADYLSALDPYKHTRSTRAEVTSGGLADDGWLRYRSYQTANDQIAATEQQVFQFPAVNNFGTGVTDADTFRHRLWNATADGQYPATVIPNEQSAEAMKVWYNFMAETRHWELEPFFDATNGRGLELEGVEYVVYVEKPGPVTVNLEKQTYEVEWMNPANGERVRVKEKSKGEVFQGTPPDASHDWVLHISREGTKASMLKSYKFDSREPALALQDAEGNPEKVPFEIVGPAEDTLTLSKPAHFSVKLKRQSKVLQNMMYEWTGEVTVSGRGYRVIGTGPEGTFTLPSNIATEFPAALHVRVTALNGLGKAYILDRNYTLTQ